MTLDRDTERVRGLVGDLARGLDHEHGIVGGFEGFADAVLKLRQTLKVPHTLPEFIKDFAPDAARRDLIAEMAIVDPTAGGNPVKLTKEAALSLLDAAISGKL